MAASLLLTYYVVLECRHWK